MTISNTIEKFNDPKHYDRYHAHVYYDADSTEHARALCDTAVKKFDLHAGNFHLKLVGPHPCWSCQLTVMGEQFESVIPWLDENRQGLTIMIHAVTGDNIKDHTDLVAWLGKPVPLNLAFFDTLNKK